MALEWNYDAQIIPVIVGTAALVFATLSLANEVFRGRDKVAHGGEALVVEAQRSIHMDIAAVGQEHLSARTIATRGAIFFGWLVGYMVAMAVIGVIPTTLGFIIAYMRIEGRESWKITLIMAVSMAFMTWLLFDQLLTVPWPQTLLGDMFPALKEYIPSL